MHATNILKVLCRCIYVLDCTEIFIVRLIYLVAFKANIPFLIAILFLRAHSLFFQNLEDHLFSEYEVPLQIPLLQSLRAVLNFLTLGNAPKELVVYLAGGNAIALNLNSPGNGPTRRTKI